MRRVLAGAVLGLALLAAPFASEALNLTQTNVEMAGCSICFQVGANQYDAVESFWNAAPVAIVPGLDLIFAQSGNTSTFFGFNFDTSENNSTTKVSTITFTIGGINYVFTDSTAVLGHFGDDFSNAHNETTAWTQLGVETFIGSDGTYNYFATVYAGYGDNLHTNGCPGGNVPSSNCFPNPWQGSAGVTFLGAGAPSPIAQAAPGWTTENPALTPCGGATDPLSQADCFDSGAIRMLVRAEPIQAPGPATLLLLGAGLLAAAAWGRSRGMMGR